MYYCCWYFWCVCDYCRHHQQRRQVIQCSLIVPQCERSSRCLFTNPADLPRSSPSTPANTRKVPSAKGEYRIINSNTREVVYVGVSKDLNRRMHDHIRSGKLSGDNSIFAYKQADGRASQARINDHERSKIEQHKPELNQRAGGAGRPYKR